MRWKNVSEVKVVDASNSIEEMIDLILVAGHIDLRNNYERFDC